MTASIPPPQYPQPPPYPYPPYPPYPPPRKSDRTLAIIITVVVLIDVVGTIVLASILYEMVYGLMSGGGPPPSAVALAPPVLTPGQATIRVIGVVPRDPLPLYGASLQVNGSEVSRIAALFDNATSNILVFQDADDDGALSPGDFFTVTTVAGTDYELWIMYQGRIIVTTIWQT